MSPLSHEPLRVSLSPSRVSLLSLGRGRRLLEGKVVACAPPEADEGAWAPAVRALREGLAELKAHPSGVTVVLSNHFIRYVLVPWNGQLDGDVEEAAYARHCFEQVYGGMASAWDIRFSPGAEGEAGVACAVDAALLAALDETMSAGGFKLRSVRPYLMAAFNLWRREFDGPLVWFVLAEEDRVCLATFKNGRWGDLQNQFADADWPTELSSQLARQRVLGNLDDEGRVYVCVPDQAVEQSLRLPGEEVHSLRLPLPKGVEAGFGASLGMALCG